MSGLCTIAGRRSEAGPTECKAARYGASGERHGYTLSRPGRPQNSRPTSSNHEWNFSDERPGEPIGPTIMGAQVETKTWSSFILWDLFRNKRPGRKRDIALHTLGLESTFQQTVQVSAFVGNTHKEANLQQAFALQHDYRGQCPLLEIPSLHIISAHKSSLKPPHLLRVHLLSKSLPATPSHS